MIASKIFAILIFTFLVKPILTNKYFEIDGIKYLLSEPVQKNWYQAYRYCRQKGMFLLDFDSEEEHTKMRQYLLEHSTEIRANSLWIAGTSLGTDKFYWFQNGADVNTNGFKPGQPDNKRGKEFCLEISRRFDFQWNDADCDRQFHFICRATKYFKLVPRIQYDDGLIQ